MTTKEQWDRLRDEYADFASKNLTLCEVENPFDLNRTFARLMIHFTFPNLNDEDREKLLQLWQLRQHAAIAFQYEDLHEDVKARLNWSQSEREKKIADYEQFHAMILESDVMDKLAPLQEELVKSAFA